MPFATRMLTVATVLIAMSCNSQAYQASPEGAAYLGYRAGFAFHSPSLSNPDFVSPERTVFAQGIHAGYQFNGPWAAELFWSDSGNYRVKSISTGNTVGLVETEVMGAGAIYRLYQQPTIDAFATAGAAQIRQDVRHADIRADEDSNLYVGAGLRWAPLPRLQARAGYNYYASELQIVRIGLAWYFADKPVQASAPPSAPEPAPEPQAARMSCDELRVVYRGVKFKHGSVTLTDSAKHELNSLAAQLRKLPDDIQFEIRAHADASGSESFNYSLSVVRARAIREYLGNYGIALNRIRAEGYGEWNLYPSSDQQSSPNPERRADLVLLGTEPHQASPCDALVVQPSSQQALAPD